MGLETSKDSIGNVIIRKPATANKADSPTVILQGHVDMVHTKTMSSNFDFEIDGIETIIKGDWVTANETTLGADNGIGVSLMMAMLASNAIDHPPIEAIFTVDEEVGMTGAMAVSPDQLSGRIMLNLDSEKDDEITVGCAGGVDVEIKGNYDVEESSRSKFYTLQISDLSGGHSGVDIQKNLANAIRLFTSCVTFISDHVRLSISSIEGGQLTNVIPNYCSGVISIDQESSELFEKKLAAFQHLSREKFKDTDPDLKIQGTAITGSFPTLYPDFQKQFLKSVEAIPNGVCQWSSGGKDIVETSNSLAVISLANGKFILKSHARSFVNEARDKLAEQIQEIFHFAEVKGIGPYPGWKPNFDSILLARAKAVYSEVFGNAPAIIAIHAGLECGILSETYPDMEIISFGPNTEGAHSPDERVQISPVQKSWKFLREILKTL